ncbi:uncharacterized protein LOC117223311 [Megalopta genalis]|uniref:uncharacterized protein LOC117223311 n=1 Tax=Megalopta genalis TaxID=115081 RepID=UPI003FD203FF
MEKRRSLSIRLERCNRRISKSSGGSGVLNPDTNNLGDEYPYWWRNLENTTIPRLSTDSTNFNQTSRRLNSNSSICENDLEDGWWNVLGDTPADSKSHQKNNDPSEKNTTTSAPAMSESDEEGMVKKMRPPLRSIVKKAKKGSDNAFLDVLKNAVDSKQPASSSKRKSLRKGMGFSVAADSPVIAAPTDPSKVQNLLTEYEHDLSTNSLPKASSTLLDSTSVSRQDSQGNSNSDTEYIVMKPKSKLLRRHNRETRKEEKNLFEDVLFQKTIDKDLNRSLHDAGTVVDVEIKVPKLQIEADKSKPIDANRNISETLESSANTSSIIFQPLKPKSRFLGGLRRSPRTNILKNILDDSDSSATLVTSNRSEHEEHRNNKTVRSSDGRTRVISSESTDERLDGKIPVATEESVSTPKTYNKTLRSSDGRSRVISAESTDDRLVGDISVATDESVSTPKRNNKTLRSLDGRSRVISAESADDRLEGKIRVATEESVSTPKRNNKTMRSLDGRSRVISAESTGDRLVGEISVATRESVSTPKTYNKTLRSLDGRSRVISAESTDDRFVREISVATRESVSTPKTYNKTLRSSDGRSRVISADSTGDRLEGEIGVATEERISTPKTKEISRRRSEPRRITSLLSSSDSDLESFESPKRSSRRSLGVKPSSAKRRRSERQSSLRKSGSYSSKREEDETQSLAVSVSSKGTEKFKSFAQNRSKRQSYVQKETSMPSANVSAAENSFANTTSDGRTRPRDRNQSKNDVNSSVGKSSSLPISEVETETGERLEGEIRVATEESVSTPKRNNKTLRSLDGRSRVISAESTDDRLLKEIRVAAEESVSTPKRNNKTLRSLDGRSRVISAESTDDRLVGEISAAMGESVSTPKTNNKTVRSLDGRSRVISAESTDERLVGEIRVATEESTSTPKTNNKTVRSLDGRSRIISTESTDDRLLKEIRVATEESVSTPKTNNKTVRSLDGRSRVISTESTSCSEDVRLKLSNSSDSSDAEMIRVSTKKTFSSQNNDDQVPSSQPPVAGDRVSAGSRRKSVLPKEVEKGGGTHSRTSVNRTMAIVGTSEEPVEAEKTVGGRSREISRRRSEPRRITSLLSSSDSDLESDESLKRSSRRSLGAKPSSAKRRRSERQSSLRKSGSYSSKREEDEHVDETQSLAVSVSSRGTEKFESFAQSRSKRQSYVEKETSLPSASVSAAENSFAKATSFGRSRPRDQSENDVNSSVGKSPSLPISEAETETDERLEEGIRVATEESVSGPRKRSGVAIRSIGDEQSRKRSSSRGIVDRVAEPVDPAVEENDPGTSRTSGLAFSPNRINVESGRRRSGRVVGVDGKENAKQHPTLESRNVDGDSNAVGRTSRVEAGLGEAKSSTTSQAVAKGQRRMEDFFQAKTSASKVLSNVEAAQKIRKKLDEMKKREITEVKRTWADSGAKLPGERRKNVVGRSAARSKKPSSEPPAQVHKAFLVNGRVYKQPRLPRPTKWVTDRLYHFLWKRMQPKFEQETRMLSERFVRELCEVSALIARRKLYASYKVEMHALMKEMARLQIIRTRHDFYNFCHDYLPYELRVKMVPMLLPGNQRNIPYEPNELHEPLLDS